VHNVQGLLQQCYNHLDACMVQELLQERLVLLAQQFDLLALAICKVSLAAAGAAAAGDRLRRTRALPGPLLPAPRGRIQQALGRQLRHPAMASPVPGAQARVC
jgi:hypothetical protein